MFIYPRKIYKDFIYQIDFDFPLVASFQLLDTYSNTFLENRYAYTVLSV